VATSDCVGQDPFAFGGGAVLRKITYKAYAGTDEVGSILDATIWEDFIWSYGPLPDSSGSRVAGEPFDDELGTRRKGAFGLTQLFFVTIAGETRRVQIQGYRQTSLRWENDIKASNTTVLVNKDPGQPCK
jgi:hypothetical protein